MIKKLDEMSLEEEQAYIDEINELFITYLPVIQGVELDETAEVQYTKLRAMVDDGKYSIGDIFFELQLNLHRYKQRYPEAKECKLIVSKLQLTKHIPGTAFRRGLMIGLSYEHKKTSIDNTEYYVLAKEYPGSPKMGTQVMVHGRVVNFCSIVHSMDGIPKYDDLIKYNDFWKKVEK